MLVGEVFARMGLDSKQYEKDLSRLEGVTRREATTLGAVFKNAFSVALGMGVFEAVKRGFQTIASTAIGFNAQMEQARIGFTTMLGSAEAADAFLRELYDFAARTPFEFLELLDASKRMLAYGFAAKDVLPTLEAVGNASAAVGLGTEGINRIILALGQMRAKGKLSAEEMRQLTETGIPAWEILAEAMNKTTAEIMDMQQKGLIPAHEAIQILIEGMNKRFPNMMAQMENTWEGVTSTIKDIWQMTIGALTSSLFEGLKTWLQGVRDWAVDFYDTFQKYGLQAALIKAFGAEIANTIISIGNAIKTIMQLVSGLFQLWVKWWKLMIVPTLGFQKVILRLVLYFFVFFKAVALAKIITQRFAYVMGILRGQTYVTGGAFGFLSAAVQYYRYQLKLANMAGITSLGVMAKMVIGIRSIGVAIKGLLASIPVIGWIVLAIGLLAEAAIYAYNNWEKAKHYILQVWSGIKQGIAYYVYGILSLYRLLFGWIPGAGKAFDVLRKKALEVAKAETAIRKARAQAFAQKPLDPYAEYEKKMEEYHKQLEEYEASLESSFAGAKDGADKTTDSIEKMNKVAGDGIQSFDEVHQLMEQAGDAAGELDDVLGLDLGLEEMPEMPEMPKMPTLEETGFIERISGMWDDIASSISTGATEAWAEFGDTMKEAWEAFKGDWEKIFKAFTWENIKQKFVDGWTGFQSWFSQTWAGQIWDKVKIKWQEVREEFTWANIKQKLINGWTGFQSWFSQTWAGKIWDGVKQKWDNLKTNAPETWDNIKKSIAERWEKLRTSAPTTWEEIRKNISDRWEALKTNAPTVWENIKTSIQDRWDSLASGASEKWGNIKSTISEKWGELKTNAPTVWENIKDEISQRWEELKVNAPTTWDNIKKEISNRWEALKTNAPTAWNNISKTIKDSWKDLKTSVPAAWNDIKKTIADKWREIKEDALSWGKNLIDGFVQGIKDKVSSVKSTLKNVGNTIKDFLGFSSPTKEGPGSDADKWAPSFMEMYRKGISQGIPGIHSSVNEIAKEMAGLATMTVMPAVRTTAYAESTADGGIMHDTIAQAVYRAIIDAFRITQASSTGTSSGESKELVLKIDNTTLARMQLPAIIREGQRQGLNLVVQPQGV